MCKHVAAVLYGVGVRLDEKPALFFTLRRVDEAELLSSATSGAVSRTRTGDGKRIAADKLGDVFGIEIEEEPVASANHTPSRAKSSRPAGTRTSRGRSTLIRRR